jgi:hypothetical protein
VARVWGQNVPPELAKDFGHFAENRVNGVVARRRRGSGNITPSRGEIRNSFKWCVNCFNERTQTEKEEWYNDPERGAMRYYNYFMKKSLLLKHKGIVPGWCKYSAGLRVHGYYNDYACRGYTDFAPVIPMPSLAWEKTVSIEDNFLIDLDQNIYVQLSTGQLRCYGGDGTQKWQTEILCSPQLLIPPYIYCTNSNVDYSAIYKVSISDGSILETYDVPGSPAWTGGTMNVNNSGEVFMFLRDDSAGYYWIKLGKIVGSDIIIVADYTDKYRWGTWLTLDPERNRFVFCCLHRTAWEISYVMVIDMNGNEIWRYPSLPEHWWMSANRAVTDEGNRAHGMYEAGEAYSWGVDIETPDFPLYHDIPSLSHCFKPNGDWFTYNWELEKTCSYDRDGNLKWAIPINSRVKLVSDDYLVVVTGNYLKVISTVDGAEVDSVNLGWEPRSISLTANGYYCVGPTAIKYYG